MLKSKYFLRIFIFSSIISIIPIILLSIFFYNKTSAAIQSKVNENNMQMLMQTHLRIENMLKVIDHNCIQLINSSTLKNLVDKNWDPKYYKEIDNLINEMSHLQASEVNIADVIVLNYAKNWAINTPGYYYLDESTAFEAYRKFLNTSENYMWTIKEENYESVLFGENETSMTTQVRKKYFINLIRKIRTAYRTTNGLLVAKIPLNEIINNLKSKVNTTHNFIILDQNNYVIWHNDERYVGEDFSLSDYVRKIDALGTKEGNFNIKVQDKSFDIIFIKSSYSGWLYFFITPFNYIVRESKIMGLFTAAVCFAVIVLLSIVSFIGSRRIYFPVKRLYELITEKPRNLKEVKEDTDEFKCINNRIRELMSSKKDLTYKLKLQFEQLKEYFLLKLVLGEMKIEEILGKVEYFDYCQNWTWMCVVTVDIDTLEGTSYTEKDKEIVLFTINNIVNEIMPGNKCLSPLVVNSLQVTIIGTEQDSKITFMNYVYSLAEALQKSIGNYLGVKVSIGISRPFGKFESVNTAYQESIEALKHKILLGQEMIIFYDDIRNNSKQVPEYPVQIESDLINALQAGDIQKANHYLKQFINEIFESNLNYLDYQVRIGKLLSELAFIIVKEGESIQAIYNKQTFLYGRLVESKTREELETWLRHEIIEPIARLIKEKRSAHGKKISDEITKIIHNEFDTDLTLDMCAKRLYYSPQYVSRVFYNETGMSFSEYLKQYRIEIAKKWLEQGNMKISDIAERLRYANSQNFIRCFKKHVGLTPGEYREKCKKALIGNTNKVVYTA